MASMTTKFLSSLFTFLLLETAFKQGVLGIKKEPTTLYFPVNIKLPLLRNYDIQYQKSHWNFGMACNEKPEYHINSNFLDTKRKHAATAHFTCLFCPYYTSWLLSALFPVLLCAEFERWRQYSLQSSIKQQCTLENRDPGVKHLSYNHGQWAL